MISLKTLAITLALAATPTAFAAGAMAGMEGMDGKAPAASSQASQPVPAEIRRIDAQAGKVTLKHGPIDILGMPAMTMAFPVKDRASLSRFQAGDAVSVTFGKIDGAPAVLDMQRK